MEEKYKIAPEESKVIQTVKLFFIILVVFLHAGDDINMGNYIYTMDGTINEFVVFIISKTIAHCAVPGFFLISSMLLYKSEFDYKKNIKKKFNSLVIPYLLLNTFWILFFWIFQSIPQLSVFFGRTENQIKYWNVIDYLNAYLGFRNGYPILYPLWFLRDLFILNVFSKIIKKTIDRFPQMIIVLILLLIIPFEFAFKNGIIFWCFGYYIVKNNIHIKRVNIIPLIILEILILLILWNIRQYNIKIILDSLNVILLIKLCIQISYYFFNNKFIEKCSKYTFFVYLFHEMNLTIVKKLSVVFLPRTQLCFFIQYFINPIIVIICCLMFAMILEKCFPQIYKLLIGYRKM